jgi:hypothetical protein
MWARHRFANTATTVMHLTRARRTATTGLTGLPAECSSAPVPGMAGAAAGAGDGAAAGAMAVRAGAVADITAVAGITDTPHTVAAAMLEDTAGRPDTAAVVHSTVRLARVSTVAPEGSTVAAVAGSMAEAAVPMEVADIGNSRPHDRDSCPELGFPKLSSRHAVRRHAVRSTDEGAGSNGWQRKLPAVSFAMATAPATVAKVSAPSGLPAHPA